MTVELLSGDAVEETGGGGLRFVAGRCNACGTRSFPVSPVCSGCQSTDIGRQRLETGGTVYALTEVHVGPAEWHRPLRLAYVDLADGLRVFGHWRGGVGIGSRVRARLGEVGVNAEGKRLVTYIFEPEEMADA